MDLLCQIFQESVQITHLTVATQASASTKVGFVIEILIVLEVRMKKIAATDWSVTSNICSNARYDAFNIFLALCTGLNPSKVYKYLIENI